MGNSLLALSHKTPNSYESHFISNGPQEVGTYLVSYQQPDLEILHLPTCKYILEILNETTNTFINLLCKNQDAKKTDGTNGEFPNLFLSNQFLIILNAFI